MTSGLTEKYTLPAQPASGESVMAGGTKYTRSTVKHGTELALDAWRDADGKAHTWAELFVIGSGEVQGAPRGQVEAILKRHIVNDDIRRAVLTALIEAPTVDTTSETQPVKRWNIGDKITRDMVEREEVTADSIKDVTRMTDRDGDRWERDGDTDRWNMNNSFSDNKRTRDLLQSYPTFTVTRVK